jgi:hypothetical protein
MKKTIFSVFFFALLISLFGCASFVTNKYDGYWLVEAKNNGKSLPDIPFKQWKIEGTTILTTVNFSADMKEIGFDGWPGEQLEMSFKTDSVLILSGNGNSLEFKMDFKDYGLMGIDIMTLKLLSNSSNLSIDLMREKKK